MSAFVLTAGLVAEATGGQLVTGAPERAFDTVSIDSRTAAAGALFIAIRGERFDGHEFAAAVFGRGAAGVLVSAVDDPLTAAAQAANGVVVRVADTLVALQALARAVRRRSHAHVIAVTGSAGKTTTKEITAELLATRYRVMRNRGNLNNHIGLPLTLLDLRSGPEVAVVELGMNHAGEIRSLVGIAEPDVRVWINVGDAHAGHFESREAIASAKAEILESPAPGALAVANADDPLVMAHMSRWTGRRRLFGERAEADVRARDVRDRGFDGTEADVETPAGPLHLRVPLAGRAQLSNVLAAITVALALDVPADRIEAVVGTLRPVARRGEIIRLPNGARIVDDSYNASPAAVEAMLTALASTVTAGQRIAVIGEMLELGDSARALHARCGRAAAAVVDQLIVVGGSAADGLVEGAREAGLAASRIHRFATSGAAADAVPALVKPNDLVLIKGSRGTRVDIVVDRLKEVA